MRVVRIVLLLIIVLSLASCINSQEARPDTRSITVSGDAEVRVVPDEVILTVGVETWDEGLDAAKEENDDIVRKLLDIADDYDIDPKHIQTDYVNIEPRYDDYSKDDFIGYFVRKTIVITLRDISKFEEVLSSALGAGANYVHGVEFRTTELRIHRDEARALAIQAAEEKATDLAGELNQKLGEPIMIREDRNWWWSGYSSWWGSRWGGGMAQNVIQNVGEGTFDSEGVTAPGQISVNASVTVEFELK